MLAPRGPLGGPLGLFRQFLRIFEGLFGLFESNKYQKNDEKQFRNKYFLGIRKPHEKYQ